MVRGDSARSDRRCAEATLVTVRRAMIAAAKANSARATDTSGWMIVFMVGSCIIEGGVSSLGFASSFRTAMNIDKRVLLALCNRRPP